MHRSTWDRRVAPPNCRRLTDEVSISTDSSPVLLVDERLIFMVSGVAHATVKAERTLTELLESAQPVFHRPTGPYHTATSSLPAGYALASGAGADGPGVDEQSRAWIRHRPSQTEDSLNHQRPRPVALYPGRELAALRRDEISALGW